MREVINSTTYHEFQVYCNSKPFSLSLQPLAVFAELRYGRRDFAKIEGRKTEKGKVERVTEGEVGG